MNRLRVPLFLVLLLLFLVIMPAHAATYEGFTVSNSPGSCTAGAQTCGGDNTVGFFQGYTLQAPFTGSIAAITIFTAHGSPNCATCINPESVIIASFSGAGTPASTANANGFPPGCTCVHLTASQNFLVLYSASAAGLVDNSFNTIQLASPIPVTVANWYFVGWECSQSGGGHSCITNCSVGCATGNFPGNMVEGELNGVTTSPLTGATIVSTNSYLGGPITGITFQTSITSVSTTTQCYGNCGSPAVTIANTNSTHATNFNQSITLFYLAQSNLNGVILNVTTNVAKTYANGESIAIGLYTVDPICTASNNPFTPQCPGFLVQQRGLSSNPSKGIFTMSTNAAVQNGQWFGLAVTGGFQGLDLNDTNTNVNLNQASGQIPTVISQYALLGTSKLALYAFVRGNSIITQPGAGQLGPGCQSLTCGIVAFWIALGGDTAAGIGAFLITLGLITGFLLYISRQHNPDGTIKGFAVPVELLGIIAVVVLIMFSVAGAIPAWIPGVIIFLVAGFFVAGMWGHRQHSNTVEG